MIFPLKMLASYGFPMVFRWFSVVQEDPRGQVHGPEGQADQGAQDGGRILPFLEDQWPFLWNIYLSIYLSIYAYIYIYIYLEYLYGICKWNIYVEYLYGISKWNIQGISR